MSKILGARLSPKWQSHDLLVAKIEFLRVELVCLLSREGCSSSGGHFRAREPAAGKLPEVLEKKVTGGLRSSRRNYTRSFCRLLRVYHI